MFRLLQNKMVFFTVCALFALAVGTSFLPGGSFPAFGSGMLPASSQQAIAQSPWPLPDPGPDVLALNQSPYPPPDPGPEVLALNQSPYPPPDPGPEVLALNQSPYPPPDPGPEVLA